MTHAIIEREMSRADRDRRIKEVQDRGENVAKFTELMEAIKTRDEEIKAMCAKALEEIGQGKTVSEEVKLKLEQFSSEGLKLQARLIEVEQKLAARTSYAGAAGQRKSWGEPLCEQEGQRHAKHFDRIPRPRDRQDAEDRHGEHQQIEDAVRDLVVGKVLGVLLQRPARIAPTKRAVCSVLMEAQAITNPVAQFPVFRKSP